MRIENSRNPLKSRIYLMYLRPTLSEIPWTPLNYPKIPWITVKSLETTCNCLKSLQISLKSLWNHFEIPLKSLWNPLKSIQIDYKSLKSLMYSIYLFTCTWAYLQLKSLELPWNCLKSLEISLNSLNSIENPEISWNPLKHWFPTGEIPWNPWCTWCGSKIP